MSERTCQHHCCRWPNTDHSHYLDPEECNACSLILHNLALAKSKADEAKAQLEDTDE